jgi:formylglycine-generating enzyme required for sulfatase activity
VGTSQGDVTQDGVHDLAANVAEWVDGDFANGKKLTRGGSWHSRTACYLLNSGCGGVSPETHAAADLGFRCARTLVN